MKVVTVWYCGPMEQTEKYMSNSVSVHGVASYKATSKEIMMFDSEGRPLGEFFNFVGFTVEHVEDK